MIAKITNWVKQYNRDIFLGVCILLVAAIGYNLGQIRALDKTPISFSQDAVIYQADELSEKSSAAKPTRTQTVHSDQRVVASKNSKSKLYHHTWCSGAKRIKEENKIWFSSAEEAESKGYTLAGNCPDSY